MINGLGRLGITAQRAQLPYQNASIWAELGTGSQLFVNAYPLGTTRSVVTVIDERQIAGIRVERVQYQGRIGSPLQYRFECSGDEYWVNEALPPGFPDMDAFVARFIRALGCAR